MHDAIKFLWLTIMAASLADFAASLARATASEAAAAITASLFARDFSVGKDAPRDACLYA